MLAGVQLSDATLVSFPGFLSNFLLSFDELIVLEVTLDQDHKHCVTASNDFLACLVVG